MSHDTSVPVISLKPPGRIRGPAPRLDTLHKVEMILRKAYERDEGPLRLAEVKRRMKVKSVRHATIRVCIDELARLGFVVEDPKRGVMWALFEDAEFWSNKGTRRLA